MEQIDNTIEIKMPKWQRYSKSRCGNGILFANTQHTDWVPVECIPHIRLNFFSQINGSLLVSLRALFRSISNRCMPSRFLNRERETQHSQNLWCECRIIVIWHKPCLHFTVENIFRARSNWIRSFICQAISFQRYMTCDERATVERKLDHNDFAVCLEMEMELWRSFFSVLPKQKSISEA